MLVHRIIAQPGVHNACAGMCLKMTRIAEILLASKSNYGGGALGLGIKWLKFEFSGK